MNVRNYAAILRTAYGKKAALYAAWKSAVREKREPVATSPTVPATPPAAGSSGALFYLTIAATGSTAREEVTGAIWKSPYLYE